MDIFETELKDVFQLEPARFGDSRGWFSETWNRRAMIEAGLDLRFVQDNHSFSADKGTLRGLHYQAPPNAQDKLVRATRGSILDVAVDIRVGSPNFGKWISVVLSAQNGTQLLIPKGFLHAFLTLEDNTEVQYKCTDFYAPESDGSVSFSDPALAIDWGIDANTAVLSDKDSKAPLLKDIKNPFVFGD